MITKTCLKHQRMLAMLLAVLLCWQATTPAGTQVKGYTLDWWTVDGGGCSVPSGTGYTLGGTVGQPDATTWQSDNGYTLSGGFWSYAPLADHQLYLPLIVRNFGQS